MADCTKCGTTGLSERASKFGGTFLAYVAEYPNGAKYYRGAHTVERCQEYKIRRDNNLRIERAYAEAYAVYELEEEAFRAKGRALNERIAEHIANGGQYDDMADEVSELWNNSPIPPKYSDFE